MPLMPQGFRVAITSGKGGVGKTSVAVHLATALAARGLRVGVVDADLALGNVDVLLGFAPERHLGHVIAGECSLDDILVDGPGGVKYAPAGSGVRSLTALDSAQWARLSAAIDAFAAKVDVLLIDTATGISDVVLDVIALADFAMVVTTFDPASLVDAYALVKLVNAIGDDREIGVLVNASRRASDAETAFRQLSLVSERFLGRPLRNAGTIALDPDVAAAGRTARVLNDSASGQARKGFADLADRLSGWAPRSRATTSRVRPPRANELTARVLAEVSPCA